MSNTSKIQFGLAAAILAGALTGCDSEHKEISGQKPYQYDDTGAVEVAMPEDTYSYYSAYAEETKRGYRLVNGSDATCQVFDDGVKAIFDGTGGGIFATSTGSAIGVSKEDNVCIYVDPKGRTPLGFQIK